MQAVWKYYFSILVLCKVLFLKVTVAKPGLIGSRQGMVTILQIFLWASNFAPYIYNIVKILYAK